MGLLQNVSKSIADESQQVITHEEIADIAREAISLMFDLTYVLDPYVTRRVVPLVNNETQVQPDGVIVTVEGVSDSHGNIEMYLLDSIERPAEGLYAYQRNGTVFNVVPAYTYNCDAHLVTGIITFDTLGEAGAAWVMPYIKKEFYARDGDTSGDSLNLAQLYSNEFQRRLSTAKRKDI